MRRSALLAGVISLCVMASPVRADRLSDAAQAYARGDVVRARSLWLSLAKGGSAEAAYRLGLLADLGQGTPENTAEAYRWYRVAANAGNASAEFNVAVMEDNARGTAHDIADAATWYARAAARGNFRAQYDLGLLYEAGDGVPRNPAAARAWFQEAAAGGLPAASAKLRRPVADRGPDSGVMDDTAQPVIPVAPRGGGIAEIGPDGSTEIVWCARPQPEPVRYFLQVVTRNDGQQREVGAQYLGVTAALVHLDPASHRYFWRVFTVSVAHARYVVTPWNSFSTHSLA